jgi:hypothetical protein
MPDVSDALKRLDAIAASADASQANNRLNHADSILKSALTVGPSVPSIQTTPPTTLAD